MELNEVLENLCYYDKRNPDNNLEYIEEEDIEQLVDNKKKKQCPCDNCFYSRTEMAEYILKLLNKEDDGLQTNLFEQK